MPPTPHTVTRLVALALAASTALVLPTTAVAASPAGRTSATTVSADRGAAPLDLGLGRPARGDTALRALGGDLDRAAALNGLTASRLREILRTDPTAYVGSSGRVFYRDVRTTPERPSVRAKGPFPDSQTFTLHSQPGAQRTLYLDFNGANVSNTYWNDPSAGGLGNRTVSGFDLDGNASTFSAAELSTVQGVWQRVSEDFAPFGIDVTTEAPPAARIDRANDADQEYGTTAVITGDKDAHKRLCESEGCTGIAALKVFDYAGSGAAGDDHGYFQPAWAFTAYFNSIKSIADTVTHEVGHNLGLNHWGGPGESYYSGHGSWFPIMGSSNNPIGQWSVGDYPGATSEAEGGRQDDLALITANGAPYRADEAGNTVAQAATGLPAGAATISTRSDVDVYSLGTCTGAVSLTGATAFANGNLDMKLSLLDASGTTVASADPASGTQSEDVATGLGATVSYNATGAPLYVAVDGVGYKTPSTQGYSDYGSLGSYLLTRGGSGSCTTGGGGGQSTAPTAPQNVAATATSSSAVTVTWSAPASNGGSAVTGYTVTRSGAAPVSLGAGTTSYSATGLAAATAYTFTVAAVNAVGTGPGASASATTSGGGGGGGETGAPSAVTGLTAAWNVSTQEALVSWGAPATSGSSPVTGYDVYVDDEIAGSVGADTTAVTVSGSDFGFAPGSVHSVAVCAFNDTAGECGAVSTATFTATAKPATAPSAPKIGKATPGASGGAKTAIVAWSAPATGGSPITSYLITASRYSGGRVVATKSFTAPASFRRGEVNVGSGSWRFRVRAVNAVGRSASSALSNAVTAR